MPSFAPNHKPMDGKNASRSTSPVILKPRTATSSLDTTSRPPHSRNPYNTSSSKAQAAEKVHSPAGHQISSQKTMQRQPFVPSTNVYSAGSGRVVPSLESIGQDVVNRAGRLPPGTYDPGRYVASGNQAYVGHGAHPSQSGQYGYVHPQSSAAIGGWPHGTSYSLQASARSNVQPSSTQPSRSLGPQYPPYTQSMHPGQVKQTPAPDGTRDSYGRKHWHARDAVPPPSHPQEEYSTDPLIHNALGWWPDQPSPSLVWNLSSTHRPRYMKRQLDADELAAPPFTPPLARMRLILNHEFRWIFDIVAKPGERYITLQGLIESISALMHSPRVPHAFWTRASREKKTDILRTMFRRTGKKMPVVPPHRRPKTTGQLMEEAVMDGAAPGYVNLLVLDLLCADVMFWGMEFHKEPDEWFLRTIGRR
ncbi:hypothetical protein EW145_g6753 [Phellinidium pouzarii]|uniref:DUF6699 domain-containing protein n=1 Tax=Phellinidium pouzarii TaxID=167371 RepID=A0A4S4KUL8_9AGAM|nr:hypothetical protein EW145_g6753 [Phellinidium pouzarii]